MGFVKRQVKILLGSFGLNYVLEVQGVGSHEVPFRYLA